MGLNGCPLDSFGLTRNYTRGVIANSSATRFAISSEALRINPAYAEEQMALGGVVFLTRNNNTRPRGCGAV